MGGRTSAFKLLAYVIVALAVVITFFPIYWMLLTSLAPGKEVMVYPPKFLPTKLTLKWWE